MKGAHISLIFSKGKMTGVKNKIEQFASDFKENNIDVYVLNRDFHGSANGVHYINYESISFSKLARFLRFFIVKKCVDFSCYDFIILRYPLFDFSALFFQKELGKVYFEHHSIELNEIKKAGFSFFFKNVQYFCERFFAPVMLKNCLGHISVTTQISEHQYRKFQGKGKYVIFSNGFSLKDKLDIPKTNNYANCSITSNVLMIAFVASEFKLWHGLDRLINSLSNYSGDRLLKIHLIGFVPDFYKDLIDCIENISVEFILYGSLSKEKTLSIISNCDLGIDSLALDRLGFTVSSTLKSKEYVFLSKPFISTTPDQDLISYEDKFWFKIKVVDDGFNFEEVISWYESIKGDVFEFPLEQLGWSYKVGKLVNEIKC